MFISIAPSRSLRVRTLQHDSQLQPECLSVVVDSACNQRSRFQFHVYQFVRKCSSNEEVSALGSPELHFSYLFVFNFNFQPMVRKVDIDVQLHSIICPNKMV
jgi:hypothetical protein